MNARVFLSVNIIAISLILLVFPAGEASKGQPSPQQEVYNLQQTGQFIDVDKAARLINEKVLQYKQKYVDKDIQDFLAMASLQYVIKMLEFENKTNKDDLSESLQELTSVIDDVLEKKSSEVL